MHGGKKRPTDESRKLASELAARVVIGAAARRTLAVDVSGLARLLEAERLGP